MPHLIKVGSMGLHCMYSLPFLLYINEGEVHCIHAGPCLAGLDACKENCLLCLLAPLAKKCLSHCLCCIWLCPSNSNDSSTNKLVACTKPKNHAHQLALVQAIKLICTAYFTSFFLCSPKVTNDIYQQVEKCPIPTPRQGLMGIVSMSVLPPGQKKD